MDFELFQKEVNRYVNEVWCDVISCEFDNMVWRIELVDGAEIKYCERSDVCVTTADFIFNMEVTVDSLLGRGRSYGYIFEEEG